MLFIYQTKWPAAGALPAFAPLNSPQVSFQLSDIFTLKILVLSVDFFFLFVMKINFPNETSRKWGYNHTHLSYFQLN